MATWKRRLPWLILAVVVAAAATWWLWRGRGAAPRFATAAVDRGDVVEVVGATGALEAVTTVQIGSQVSGTIQSLGADFNSHVKRGQVIARLDPSLFEARLGQARANLLAARANVERARSSVDDTRLKFERARELRAQQLVAQSDVDSARAAYEGAVAQLKANEAAVSQAEASVHQAQVDLEHTVISTPIDGVVITRSVDVGQTVAASFQAPVLFVIAGDLTRMRVNASVDEADVGRVKEGQAVSFHVDAFPEREFQGRVEQVRLSPTTVQNVVSYNAIVAVDNRDLLLRPGMTATVSIVVREARDVLRLPASALRFRPEGFEAGAGRRRGGAGAGASGGAAARGARRDRGTAATDTATDGSERSRGRRSVVFTPGPDGQPAATPVVVGISDGQKVALVEGLAEGALVITGAEIAGAPRAASPGASPSANPFSPGRPQPRQR